MKGPSPLLSLPARVRQSTLAAAFVPHANGLHRDEDGVVVVVLYARLSQDGGARPDALAFQVWSGPWSAEGESTSGASVVEDGARVRWDCFGTIATDGTVELGRSSILTREIPDLARQLLALEWLVCHVPAVLAFAPFRRRLGQTTSLPDGAFLLHPTPKDTAR